MILTQNISLLQTYNSPIVLLSFPYNCLIDYFFS